MAHPGSGRPALEGIRLPRGAASSHGPVREQAQREVATIGDMKIPHAILAGLLAIALAILFSQPLGAQNPQPLQNPVDHAARGGWSLSCVHPRDYVRITGPYTVPLDKIFVGTGTRHRLPVSHSFGYEGQLFVSVSFNGSTVLTNYTRLTMFDNFDNNKPTATGFGEQSIPVGLSAPAGTMIDVGGGSTGNQGSPGGCLLGYLVDA